MTFGNIAVILRTYGITSIKGCANNVMHRAISKLVAVILLAATILLAIFLAPLALESQSQQGPTTDLSTQPSLQNADQNTAASHSQTTQQPLATPTPPPTPTSLPTPFPTTVAEFVPAVLPEPTPTPAVLPTVVLMSATPAEIAHGATATPDVTNWLEQQEVTQTPTNGTTPDTTQSDKEGHSGVDGDKGETRQSDNAKTAAAEADQNEKPSADASVSTETKTDTDRQDSADNANNSDEGPKEKAAQSNTETPIKTDSQVSKTDEGNNAAEATSTPEPTPTTQVEPTQTVEPTPTVDFNTVIVKKPTTIAEPQSDSVNIADPTSTPTPIPEPTLTPTPTPTVDFAQVVVEKETPTPQAQDLIPNEGANLTAGSSVMYVDSHDGLLVRDSAGGNIVAALDHGQQVRTTSLIQTAKGRYWVKIESPSSGWVALDYLTQEKPTTVVVTLPKASEEPTAQDWHQLRMCESTNNYTVVDKTGLYHGAYQFSIPTWDGLARRYWPELVGVPPSQARPEDQDKMAFKLYELEGARPWPVCGAELL